MLKYAFEEQNWYALQSSKLQVKAEFAETCPLTACCPAILSFQIQTDMGATLRNYMCLGVCVGCCSPSSGVPVLAAIARVSLVAFQCGTVSTKCFQWCSSVPCNYSLGRPVVSQCTLDQPVAFQWHSSVHWPANKHWLSVSLSINVTLYR